MKNTRLQLHLLFVLSVGAIVVSGGNSTAVTKLKSALNRLKADMNQLVNTKVLQTKQRAIKAIDTVISSLDKKKGTTETSTPAFVKIETIEMTDNGLKVETLTTRKGEPEGVSNKCSFPWILAREGLCFWSPPLKGTWADADAFCRVQGGYLATVRSRDEVRLVELFHPIDKLCPWIGLRKTIDKFYWSSGSESKYRFWAPRQPDGMDHRNRRFPGPRCAILCQDGMQDMSCGSYNAPFVCQKDISS